MLNLGIWLKLWPTMLLFSDQVKINDLLYSKRLGN